MERKVKIWKIPIYILFMPLIIISYALLILTSFVFGKLKMPHNIEIKSIYPNQN